MEASKVIRPEFEEVTSQASRPPEGPQAPRRARKLDLFAPELVGPAFKQAFAMLRPDVQWSNPVMFVVEIGAFLTLGFIIQAAMGLSQSQVPITYFIALDIWL